MRRTLKNVSSPLPTPPPGSYSCQEIESKASMGDFSGGPVVKTLRFHCRGAQVRSLVGELTSHQEKKKERKRRKERKEGRKQSLLFVERLLFVEHWIAYQLTFDIQVAGNFFAIYGEETEA